MKDIHISSKEEQDLRKELERRSDPEGLRLRRFLDLPDLTRASEGPLLELITRIKNIERFKDFDTIHVPEIVRADASFDLFNFSPDHPTRSRSDTYYVNDEYILRTHTTIMWYYYFLLETIKAKVKKHLPFGVLSYGKVYRKDEIDRHHMNVFHQMDGLYLSPREEKVITIGDLQAVLVEIAQAIYGSSITYRFNEDTFPYTDPSIEMEIEKGGQWVEVLGGGLVRAAVLKNFTIDPMVYTGWAFGFGLERLAIVSTELPDIRLLWSDDPRVKRQLHLGSTYVPVSKYPPITRDISFVVGKDFVPNNFYDVVRDIGGISVEEVKLFDHYDNPEKFGKDKTSYTFRIVYRSNDRTLTDVEVNAEMEKISEALRKDFAAEVR